MKIATRQILRGDRTDDRVRAEVTDGRAIVALSDGAGGLPGGAVAAEEAVQALVSLLSTQTSHITPAALCDALASLDGHVRSHPRAGECTAVVAAIVDGLVFGASVGDSEAWLVHAQDHHVLTADQQRKRLGSGRAAAVGFGPVELAGGRLLIGSDGLFGHARAAAIIDAVRTPDLEGAATAVVELPRTSNGSYGDDVSVALIDGSAAHGPMAPEPSHNSMTPTGTK